MRKFLLGFLAVALTFSLSAQDRVDKSAVKKIRQEGLENSKVMEMAFNLTEVSGPRLTNSPGFKRAADYAMETLRSYGLTNVDYEKWGEFGEGWELERSYIAMTAPYYKPIVAFPKSWVKGTNGLQKAGVVVISVKDSSDLENYKGKLGGKFVLIENDIKLANPFEPFAKRHTDEHLEKLADAKPDEMGGYGFPRRAAGGDEDFQAMIARFQKARALRTATQNLIQSEGALGILSVTAKGRDGTVFVQSGGSYQKGSEDANLDMVLNTEDFMMLTRLAKAGVDVEIEVDVKTKFFRGDLSGYNVIAEIEGSDPKLKDEIVMLGAHLDSWHGGTGATDNAAGSAVMMEAVRILQATGLKPKRTIRVALWSGEEQGILGSRNYVQNHFVDKETNWSNAAGDKVSAYYNFDNGTGKIRGIYLQENEALKPTFTKWFEPFHDLDAKTVTITNTGSTDHVAFDGVGIPGFQFIQEPMEYDTRTHHSTADTYDHLYEDDLKQSATIIASLIYHTAQRKDLLPRKPKPENTQRRGFF